MGRAGHTSESDLLQRSSSASTEAYRRTEALRLLELLADAAPLNAYPHRYFPGNGGGWASSEARGLLDEAIALLAAE